MSDITVLSDGSLWYFIATREMQKANGWQQGLEIGPYSSQKEALRRGRRAQADAIEVLARAEQRRLALR
jgi:hypothetical protein